MRLADMHIHTTFSPDGKSSMEEQCIKAIESGIPIICFTDHVDFNSSEINVGTLIYFIDMSSLVTVPKYAITFVNNAAFLIRLESNSFPIIYHMSHQVMKYQGLIVQQAL